MDTSPISTMNQVQFVTLPRRRAALEMRFDPRTTRGAAHMRKELKYLIRYAPMVNRTERGRHRFDAAISWARTAMASRLVGLPEAWQNGYEEALAKDTLTYNAEYSCIVAYVNLFLIADRIYFALGSSEAFDAIEKGLRQGMKADVRRILRNVAVQVAGGEMDARIQ